MVAEVWERTLVGIVATLAIAGCADARLQDGIFRSRTGYRIAVPGPDWTVTQARDDELSLRHRAERAAMLAHASCNGADRTKLPVLALQLVSPLRDRHILEQGEAMLDGDRGLHWLLEGRSGADGEPVKVEAYVGRDERCVYDFLYVTPAASFDAFRPDFQRFVASFTRAR